MTTMIMMMPLYLQSKREEQIEEVKEEVLETDRPVSREQVSRPLSGRTKTATTRLFDDAATVCLGFVRFVSAAADGDADNDDDVDHNIVVVFVLGTEQCLFTYIFWRKLVAKSPLVPQRPSRLRDRCDEMR